jgi:hypothetical protein
MHRQSGDDGHALIRFDPQAAARIDNYVLDGAGEGSAKASWMLIRRSKKRTCLCSAALVDACQ